LTDECRLRVFKNRVLRRMWAWEGRGNRGLEEIPYVFLTKHYSSAQIKKNDKGRACSMFVGEERYMLGSGGET
jgi:hypothetical protein